MIQQGWALESAFVQALWLTWVAHGRYFENHGLHTPEGDPAFLPQPPSLSSMVVVLENDLPHPWQRQKSCSASRGLSGLSPLDCVKCCFEITSCLESQSVLNLLTHRTSSESLLGNIKYQGWPWNEALGLVEVRSGRLREQQGELHPTGSKISPQRQRPVGSGGGGMSWV